MSLNTLNRTTTAQTKQDPDLDDDAFETELVAIRGVQTVIANVAIEASLTAETRRLLKSRTAFVAVVEVPAADWCEAVCLALVEMNSSTRVRQVLR